jgi:hypothetical protein
MFVDITIVIVANLFDGLAPNIYEQGFRTHKSPCTNRT